MARLPWESPSSSGLTFCDGPLGSYWRAWEAQIVLAGSLCLVPLCIRRLHLGLGCAGRECSGMWTWGAVGAGPTGAGGTVLALADPAAPALLVVG